MNDIQTGVNTLEASEVGREANAYVERGRELAGRAVEEIIEEMWRRSARHQLDRGVRLSFPYYDDHRLSLRWRDFTVIPRGRILFVPAFVVIAAEREIERVRLDRQLNESTREHLAALLDRLRQAFGLSGLR
jgi:hypothetical protein